MGTPRIAPFINVTFYVTSIFGETGTRTHRGLDIATSIKQKVYSMTNGIVILNTWNDSYGNYIIIKGDDGIGFLYAHLDTKPLLNVGSRVIVGQEVGTEGTSGESTGVHLHLEMQDISNKDWVYQAPIEDYINPATFMGIDNVKGTSWLYDGTPIFTKSKKKKFKWVLYARKLRNNVK